MCNSISCIFKSIKDVLVVFIALVNHTLSCAGEVLWSWWGSLWNSDNMPFGGGMCFVFSFSWWNLYSEIRCELVPLWILSCVMSSPSHINDLQDVLLKVLRMRYFYVLLFWIYWLHSLEISVRGLEYGWPCMCKALYHCFEQTQQ